MNTILENFKKYVKNSPEKPVLIFDDEIISYKKLNELVNALSNSLLYLKQDVSHYVIYE